MPGTYKMIRIVGTSSEGISEAVQAAIKEASKTLKGLAWFEVKEIRGVIKEEKVAEYQATVEIGFKVIHE
jgi:flavin-binding protein dodecin